MAPRNSSTKFFKVSYKTHNFDQYEDNPWVQLYAPHIDARAKKFRNENSLKGIYGPVYESNNDNFPAGSRERKVFYKPQPVRGSQAMKRLSKASNSKLSEKDYETLQNLGDVEVRMYGGNNGQPYRATIKPTKAKQNIAGNLKALYTRSQNESMPWSGFDSLRMNLITNPKNSAQRKKMADFLNYIASDYQGGGYANYEVMPKIKPGPTRGSQVMKRLSKKLNWEDIENIINSQKKNSGLRTLNLGFEAGDALYPSAQFFASMANTVGRTLPNGKVANALRRMNTSDIVENGLKSKKLNRNNYYWDVKNPNVNNKPFRDASKLGVMEEAYALGKRVRGAQRNISLAGLAALAASMYDGGKQGKPYSTPSLTPKKPTRIATKYPTATITPTITPTVTPYIAGR